VIFCKRNRSYGIQNMERVIADFFRRLLDSCSSTGTNKWWAQLACKFYIFVDFIYCTGSDNVKTIGATRARFDLWSHFLLQVDDLVFQLQNMSNSFTELWWSLIYSIVWVKRTMATNLALLACLVRSWIPRWWIGILSFTNLLLDVIVSGVSNSDTKYKIVLPTISHKKVYLWSTKCWIQSYIQVDTMYFSCRTRFHLIILLLLYCSPV
jgi:hypothetical protein